MNHNKLALVALLVATSSAISGPLNPPSGPISPTGKTLTEVEPRVAINSTNTPGDANSAFKITRSGSYYLTQDYSILGFQTDLHAIEIAANNVTIDLNGFTLTGLSGALSGIVTDGGDYRDIVIRNGTIKSFDYGIKLDRNDGNDVVVENMQVIDNDTGGLYITSGHIRNCVVRGNGGVGIWGTSDTIIEGCTVANNDSTGIFVNTGSIIRDCIIRSNFNDGVHVGSRCIVRDNVISGNGIATGDRAGVQVVGNNSLIKDNVISDNEYGIRSSSVSVLVQNIVTSNFIDIDVSGSNPGLADQSSSPSGAGAWDNIVLP